MAQVGPRPPPIPVDKVVTQVGSALGGHRRGFLAMLGDPSVGRIVVEHRDRFCGSALNTSGPHWLPRGGELVVIGSAGVVDDLVGDMTEILR